MLDTALVVGLAAVYLWFLLAHATITEPVFRRARKADGWVGELVGCAWCAGWWITGILLLVTGQYDPITHLAAATVCGVVGGQV